MQLVREVTYFLPHHKASKPIAGPAVECPCSLPTKGCGRVSIITQAGRLARIGSRQVLRMTQHPESQALDERVAHASAV